MNPSTLSDDELYPLIEARHSDPFKILGIREARGSQFGRVFRPDAAEVTIVDAGDAARRFPLTKIHPDGLFESALQGVDRPFDYLLEMKSHSGDTWREKDAYSFGPSRERILPFGRQTPSASRWWETSTIGTDGCTACAR